MKVVWGAIAMLLATMAHDAKAQTPGWIKSPTIAVLGAPDDPRVQAARDAVEFWNGTLADLSTRFRLGALHVAKGTVPDDELQKLSLSPGALAGKAPMPAAVRDSPDNLVIVLSDANFVSFALRWPDQNKAMVAIKNHRTSPLNMPNVLHNVVAHEIGHAIGLVHNSDPAMLMCGRPSDCRPDLFRSVEPRYFPLTQQDRDNLRRMYPVDWTAR